MNRGERVANRTRSSIKSALLDLIHEGNYPDITVGEITKKGNIGRSTFYRHYRSKAEVLVDIHRDMFTRLFSGMSSADAWLSPEPPPELVSFLETYKRLGRHPFSLSYKLGSDLDFLIGNITRQFTAIIEQRLRDTLAEEECRIPLPVFAQSVTASYMGLTISWFTRFQSMDARLYAAYVHRIVKAIIRESCREQDEIPLDGA